MKNLKIVLMIALVYFVAACKDNPTGDDTPFKVKALTDSAWVLNSAKMVANNQDVYNEISGNFIENLRFFRDGTAELNTKTKKNNEVHGWAFTADSTGLIIKYSNDGDTLSIMQLEPSIMILRAPIDKLKPESLVEMSFVHSRMID